MVAEKSARAEKIEVRAEDRDWLFEQVKFKPTKEQLEILNHPARVKLVAGGERAGKSRLGAMYCFKEIVNSLISKTSTKPVFWLVAADYERTRAEFEYLTELLVKAGLARKLTKRVDPGQIECVGGVVIRTKSASDYRSLAMEAPEGIVCCEASQIDYESFLRLRGRVAEKRGWLLLEGTFEGSFGWYPERWKAWQAYPNQEDAKSFSLPSWSNTYVYPGGRNDPEIVSLQAIHSDDWFAERYAGIPSPPRGLVHTLFRTEFHVQPEVVWEPGEDVHVWIDPGYRGAYAVEVAHVKLIDGNPQVRIFDEIYERGLTGHDICDVIMTRPWWGKSATRGVIDIAGTQHHAMPAQTEVWLAKTGLYLDYSAVNLLDGIERLNTFLKINPITKAPGLLINPSCRGIISEFGGGPDPFDGRNFHPYKWKTDSQGNIVGTLPEDRYNHGIKAVTYGIAHPANYGYARFSAPSGREVIKVRRWT